MKVALVSPLKKERILKALKKFGFEVDEKNPEIVVCYGGDGTILYSERKYPSVPKLVIKYNSKIWRKYEYSSKNLEKILKKISEGKFKIHEEIKVEARFKGKKILGLNEIQVHNKIPTKALKFSLVVNRKKFKGLVGDGVIISTPFGSTAYYSSTGGKPFKKGIGISFNNLFGKKIKSFVVSENSKIKVKIEKGIGLILADNFEKYFQIKEGEEVLVKKSKENARFIFV
ncbi:MAG: hypothetical protein QW403_03070 [Candidatus Aenigmatarchaeota archaeon]